VAGNKYSNNVFYFMGIYNNCHSLWLFIIGVLQFGECTGLRVENSATPFAPKVCVALGGTCCDLGSFSKSI
jgi:hypothetical protein